MALSKLRNHNALERPATKRLHSPSNAELLKDKVHLSSPTAQAWGFFSTSLDLTKRRMSPPERFCDFGGMPSRALGSRCLRGAAGIFSVALRRRRAAPRRSRTASALGRINYKATPQQA